jgi:hypothetical protein
LPNSNNNKFLEAKNLASHVSFLDLQLTIHVKKLIISCDTVPYFILCPVFKLRNRAREKGKGEGGGEKRGGRERGMWGRTACGCLSS